MTTTARLMALYPGQPRWGGNIHSLTACLCGYYTTYSINFLHLLRSTASLSDPTISFYNLTPSFLWPASRSYTFQFNINAFFWPNYSRPFFPPHPSVIPCQAPAARATFFQVLQCQYSQYWHCSGKITHRSPQRTELLLQYIHLTAFVPAHPGRVAIK